MTMSRDRYRAVAWIASIVSISTSCQELEPLGVQTAPVLAPSFSLHDTSPPGCYRALSEPPCLLDDVETAWVGTGVQGSTYTFEIVSATTPTSRGSVLDATFRTIATGSGVVLGEGSPPCWFRSHAYRDRNVIIQGRNIDCSYVYFTFTSRAPLPVPRVIEFERPEPVQCSPGRNCTGPFRIVIDLPGSGWYNGDETVVFVESTNGSRWSLPGSIRVEERLWNGQPQRSSSLRLGPG
jgi:hypothetical protein